MATKKTQPTQVELRVNTLSMLAVLVSIAAIGFSFLMMLYVLNIKSMEKVVEDRVGVVAISSDEDDEEW